MPDQSRQDREEVIELLNELRVLLPGVQVLFAFLLTVPFTQRFSELERADKGVYFSALVLAAAASVLLIAPSLHARLTWQRLDRRALIDVSNQLTVLGSILLAAGMACAVYLIADVLYRSRIAAVSAAAVVVLVAFAWYGLPLAVWLSRSRAAKRLPQPAGRKPAVNRQ
ncbi:MAG: hypothetical protein QOJ19_3270 [Acidimicrobiia bacterium]|nr:hypothetical protein [Acidimicrobiia bacterium]